MKIVLDTVLQTKSTHGWLNQLIASTIGDDKLAILKLAAVAALSIALIGALCSYAEKYLTTSVGQSGQKALKTRIEENASCMTERISLSFFLNSRDAFLIRRVKE